jgi:hypothetical protein
VADPPSLPAALDAEIDDVLSMLPILDTVPGLADRVFHRLVDCLVEAVLHDVQSRHRTEDGGRAGHLREICVVVAGLQERGLLDDEGSHRRRSGPLVRCPVGGRAARRRRISPPGASRARAARRSSPAGGARR